MFGCLDYLVEEGNNKQHAMQSRRCRDICMEGRAKGKLRLVVDLVIMYSASEVERHGRFVRPAMHVCCAVAGAFVILTGVPSSLAVTGLALSLSRLPLRALLLLAAQHTAHYYWPQHSLPPQVCRTVGRFPRRQTVSRHLGLGDRPTIRPITATPSASSWDLAPRSWKVTQFSLPQASSTATRSITPSLGFRSGRARH